ncbi:phospholipase [Croceibacterium ferulae]|uniref:carboxylesterase family protein n=1 Tax=Croceibacterium ferulae TaxID=1854641 RepID=UPI000F87316A|nr:phospholipase [Croceibacterium ferulae]
MTPASGSLPPLRRVKRLLLPIILAPLFACVAPLASGAAPVPLVAGQFPQPALVDRGYPYQLFIPRAAAAVEDDGQDARWPLLIFLHGSGERGVDIARVKAHGPPKIADRDPDFPFILVSPLLPAEEDWDIAKLDAIVDHVAARLPVDPDRIYLTGLSRGGHATWRWGAAEPQRFAALAPVAGRGDPATGCALVDVPVWALHGDRDDVVVPEGSFAMARAIRACGGQRSRLTIYPDLGHNAWDPAYDSPALYLWLLQQRRQPAAQ